MKNNEFKELKEKIELNILHKALTYSIDGHYVLKNTVQTTQIIFDGSLMTVSLFKRSDDVMTHNSSHTLTGKQIAEIKTLFS